MRAPMSMPLTKWGNALQDLVSIFRRPRSDSGASPAMAGVAHFGVGKIVKKLTMSKAAAQDSFKALFHQLFAHRGLRASQPLFSGHSAAPVERLCDLGLFDCAG